MIGAISAIPVFFLLPFSLATPTRSSGVTKVSDLRPRQSASACPAHNSAVGTFFCSGTDPNQVTACGNTYDSSSPGVAINTQLIANSEALAPYCGQTIIISNTDPVNGQLYMTSAPIIDLCATCDEGSDQLDLSPATFESLGMNADCNAGGQLNIAWFFEDQGGLACI